MADPKYADLPGIVSLSKVSITCRIFVSFVSKYKLLVILLLLQAYDQLDVYETSDLPESEQMRMYCEVRCIFPLCTTFNILIGN